jgi:RNA polymerase sigma-70 factor (ECF subfamily)
MTEPTAGREPLGPDRSDPDAELLRRWCAGDRGALTELAARHERGLLGAARSLLGTHRGAAALAQEAVQETWLRVMRAAPGFRGESTVKTWLYTITLNHCRAILRRAETRLGASGADASALAAVASPGPAEIHDDLSRALTALSPEQQELISLCYHAQLSHGEVASMLSIPVGTVKSRLNAALTRLRGLLAASPLAQEVSR